MKLHIIAVGKRHDTALTEAINEYTVRLQRYWPLAWQLLSSPHAHMSPEEQRQRESAAILAALHPADIVILLDERGTEWSTPQLAQQMEAWRLRSERLVYIIGGAHGVTEEVRQRAHKVWALSPLVFPHHIVRLLLSEQLYRAATIIKGEPYHHS